MRGIGNGSMLARVGLGDRGGHYPRQLSGGEQQRVALARASVVRPAVLFADEPTGNLDTTTGDEHLPSAVRPECARRSTTLLLVTHDVTLAARCGRTLTMSAGRTGPAMKRRADARLSHAGARVALGRSGGAVPGAVGRRCCADRRGISRRPHRSAMQLQASEVLGADLRLQSPDVIADTYAQEAAAPRSRHGTRRVDAFGRAAMATPRS